MTNELTDIDKKLIDEQQLKNRWPEECLRLPLDYLKPEEKQLAERCINHEQLTEEEIKELKQLLANYRPLIGKYDTVKLEENIDNNIQIIDSSLELLELLDDPDRYRFDMHVKIKGKLFRLRFRMKPLSDNDYMELLNAQTRIFKDLNKSEKIVYSKASNEMPLSPEEEKMVKNIEDKIVEKLGDVDKNNDHVTSFLIDNVELLNDSNLNKTQRKKFWQTMDLGSRVLIYNKCKEIANIDENLEVELFPSVR